VSTALRASRAPLPADRHPVLVYLARLAPSGRRTMRQALEDCSRILSSGTLTALELPWHELRHQHTAALRARLAELSRAPATANKKLTAVRQVLQECWRLELMPVEAYWRASEITPVRGTRLKRGRALSQGELGILFESCAEDPKPRRGARDAALIALLYGGGLRRGELWGVDLAHYRDGAVDVLGKGNKEDLVPLPQGARRALARYLEHRGLEPGPLIQSLRGGRLRGEEVYRIIRRRYRRAGLRKMSPHDLRRTQTTVLLSRGCDLEMARQLARHKKLETTAGYDRRPDETRAEKIELLEVPYADPVARLLAQRGG
jgi:integrase/recombinase XerD